MVTQLSDLDRNVRYSYADYLTWQLDEAVELIKGKIFPMSPAPRRIHQAISRNLEATLIPFFQQSTCELYHAPFDVRLYDRRKSVKAAKEVFSVVQPDICVVCDPAKLDDLGCNGAPDFIVEILSDDPKRKRKSGAERDLKIKYALYEENGVREYWVVDPELQTLHQFWLDEDRGAYRLLRIWVNNEVLTAQLFPDLQLDLAEVFGLSDEARNELAMW